MLRSFFRRHYFPLCSCLIIFPLTWIRSFQAIEAKLLRVVVSSFYDYMLVALKVYQEFDTSIEKSIHVNNLPREET